MSDGWDTIVARLHEGNISYLSDELKRLEKVAMRLASERGDQDEAVRELWLSWSALHLAHGLLERAWNGRSFVDVGLTSERLPRVRVGRARSFTLSWGYRSQGPRRPWKRMLWLQLWGRTRSFDVGETEDF